MIKLMLAGTVMMLWGTPIEGVPNPDLRPLPGTVMQLFVCKGGDHWVQTDCLAYGQGHDDMAGCVADIALARQDFPGESYGCLRVLRSDLERPLGLKP